jgi:hypothetical protein
MLRAAIGVFLLLPVLATAQPQGAESPLYRVELLVFSYPAGGRAEHWDPLPVLAYPRQAQLLNYPGQSSGSAATPNAQQTHTSGTAAGAPTVLPASQRQFRDKAAAMNSSGRYRVLFHEAWTQALSGQSSAIPVVLDKSGDGGAWPELQGSVTLYVSRFLYLETNLWLNTQGEYLQSAWRMPAPPKGPASRPVMYEAGAVVDTLPEPTPTPLPGSDPLGAPEEDARPLYPYKHAVLLKQTRRMRSGEINYIDHPMLGVMVKITPLGND